ncbi:MAG: AraC family transcriptional regulator [Clostridia bacterium]|nr:AraC family transcriptional regulator [Clostridia bacterium]
MYVYKSSLIGLGEKCDLRVSIHENGSTEELHRHEFVEFELVLSGEGMQVINGVNYPMRTGDICFFNVNDKHSFYAEKDLTILDLLIKPDYFYNELLGQEQALLELPSFIRLLEKDKRACLDMMRLAMEEYDKGQVGYRLIVNGYVQIFVATLFRMAAYSSSNPYNEVNEILTYLENNFATVKLSQIAKMFNYSESYFSRLFKRRMGVSFSKYIADKKMEKAIQLVTFTNEKIENICLKVGYRDKTQFYKTFRQYTGTTPQQMREGRARFSEL